MINIVLIILNAILSFILLKIYLRFPLLKIYCNDRNKPYKRKLLTCASIPVLFNTFLFTTIYIYINLFNLWTIVILVTIILAFLIGLIDDIVRIHSFIKVVTTFVPTIPVIIALHYFYPDNWLYIALLGMIVIVSFPNGYNIVAGYDGLEYGIGIIMLGTLSLLNYINGNYFYAIHGTIIIGVIFPFELMNWYPSRGIGGNCGSFTIGTVIAIIGFFSGFLILLFILHIPHLIEFFLKIKYRGKSTVFGKVLSDGSIIAPENPKSIFHYIMKLGKFRERDITIIFLTIELLLACVAIVLWLLLGSFMAFYPRVS